MHHSQAAVNSPQRDPQKECHSPNYREMPAIPSSSLQPLLNPSQDKYCHFLPTVSPPVKVQVKAAHCDKFCKWSRWCFCLMGGGVAVGRMSPLDVYKLMAWPGLLFTVFWCTSERRRYWDSISLVFTNLSLYSPARRENKNARTILFSTRTKSSLDMKRGTVLKVPLPDSAW